MKKVMLLVLTLVLATTMAFAAGEEEASRSGCHGGGR